MAPGCFPEHLIPNRSEGISVRHQPGQVHVAQVAPDQTPPSAAKEDLLSREDSSSSETKKKKKTTVLKAGCRGAKEPNPAHRAPPIPTSLARQLTSLQRERQLRQRYFSSTVLSSTSNILSDIQEYTYLQMKGISYAIDFCIGSALYGKHLSNSSRCCEISLPLEGAQQMTSDKEIIHPGSAGFPDLLTPFQLAKVWGQINKTVKHGSRFNAENYSSCLHHSRVF